MSGISSFTTNLARKDATGLCYSEIDALKHLGKLKKWKKAVIHKHTTFFIFKAKSLQLAARAASRALSLRPE